MSTSTTPIPSPSRPTIALQPSTSRDNTSPQAGPSTPRYSTGAARIAKRHHAHPGCTLCSIVSAVADTQSIPTQSSGGIDRARSPSPSPTATTTFLPPSNQTPTSPNGVAYPQPGALPRGSSLQVLGREIVYFDEEITIYKALGKERLCAEGRHLVVVLNRHLESIYELVCPLTLIFSAFTLTKPFTPSCLSRSTAVSRGKGARIVKRESRFVDRFKGVLV